MSSIRIVEMHEREARVFPRSELFDTFGRPLILAETRLLAAVELRDVLEGVQLRALGLVGYLPLTSTIVLNLRPKFSTDNLWQMLAAADETYEGILSVLRSYEAIAQSAPHQLLARGFSFYLGRILQHGVARSYHREFYSGPYRPKVDFIRTSGRFVSRGDYINTVSQVFTYSSDIPINALLKSACLQFSRLMPDKDNWAQERALLSDTLNALDNVRPRQMHLSDLDLCDLVPAWVREAYRGALTVYCIFLGLIRIGFAYDSHGHAMPSFLFSLDDIFESFVRNTLRTGLVHNKISVADGNAPQHQGALFRDNKRFPVKPDLILKRNKTVCAIGEAKYKPRLEEADRYQLISHVIALRAPVGIWISPALSDESSELEYVGSIDSGQSFYHYRLKLSGDLGASVDAMIANVAKLVEAAH